jgi:nicotinamide-nucleotide adenylyltransferase
MVAGLFIGRFQPFHKGHAEAVEYCLKHCNKMVIMIGSPKKYGDENNPFTLSERKKMIKLGLKKKILEKCRITSVPDFNNDVKWTKAVGKTKFDVVFTNNSNVEDCLKEHDVRDIPVEGNYNATQVRRKMYLDQNWKDCVPRNVAAYLEKIKAPQRIKDILK